MSKRLTNLLPGSGGLILAGGQSLALPRFLPGPDWTPGSTRTS
jgi:hypothetical protein